MKWINCWMFIVLSAAYPAIPSLAQSSSDQYQQLQHGFKNPPSTARPKVYWWCLNGNIDTVSARQEFTAMKKAGIMGFDFFEIGVPKSDTMIPAGPAFLSEASLETIKFAVTEAGKLGLEMGLNLSSSWNAGGAWTLPQNAGKSLYHSKITIKGGSGVKKINLPFPEISFPKTALIGGTGKPMIPFQANGKPVYYEEIAILAIPSGTARGSLDTSEIIDVSKYFDSTNDLLNWDTPPGDWEIMRYVCSNSGQQLVLPSPYSAGLTIDHFDSVAVETHLMYIIDRLRSALGDDFRKTALKSFYLASYEARGFVWTSSLAAAFKQLNGYDIVKFLPSFFDPELFSKEITENIQKDFKKTLSELMINNLYKKAKQICNHYGLKINSEAGGPGFPLYNGPAEPLKALGALDIPRGEFWVNHSRYYKDDESKDSIDILRVVKEVSAASHIYQKGIVEEEAFTSFQNWQEGPFDIKPLGDRAFCEGMNKVVFHGFSHNPRGTGFPGNVYHAGTHFNNKRVWWPKVGPFVDYLSRISYIFQEADFVSDVLYYYGDRIPNSAAPKNTHFTVGPGYDYEVINTEILLNELRVEDGRLVLSNGAHFSMLALENEKEINPLVLRKLKKFASQGAVIVGARPEQVASLKNESANAAADKAIIDRLWTNISGTSAIQNIKSGKIYEGIKPAEMLSMLKVAPDFNYPEKESWLIDYIHYAKNDMDFYFIRNTADKWISTAGAFRQQGKVPEIWDPITGEIISISVYQQNGSYIEMPISLPPFGSTLIVFNKRDSLPHFYSIVPSQEKLPLIAYTKHGLQFLEDGTYHLKGSEGLKEVKNEIEIKNIDGPWKLRFPKNWGAPDAAVFPKLISWTEARENGIKYFSGTATYDKVFYFSHPPADLAGRRIYLNLGEIAKLAEVWLNGKPLGITWSFPYKFDITNFIRTGKNELRVEVANTWSNRLVGDALTNASFTRSNIRTSTRGGLPWSKTPLIRSGLLGPVTLELIKPVGDGGYRNK